MAKLIQQSTANDPLFFFLTLSSDHLSPATGKTPTVTISKNGAAFGSPAGAVSEIANGWYQVAGNATDTATLGDILLHATEASSDNSDMVVAQVVAFNPRNVNLGISNISTTSNIKKNQALNAFEFTMTDSTTHAPKTGLTVSATRSLDGAAFAATANSPTEIANGDYAINLAAADLNANTVMLRFTAAGADDLNILIITQP
jgi:hypothetical protein